MPWSGVSRRALGLSDAEIDELLLPVGINLPEEARVWWRWHNGQQVASDGTVHTLAGREILSRERAVQWHERFRVIDYGAFGVDGLIPLLMEQPVIHIDCSRNFADPVPVYTIGHGEGSELVLGSLGDLVAAILDLLDEAWQIGADGHVRRNQQQETRRGRPRRGCSRGRRGPERRPSCPTRRSGTAS
jgi:hypothetical protein